MPNFTNQPENVLLEWKTPSFEAHKRGRLWYAIASFITVALLFYAVFSNNFLFAIIILIFAIIITISSTREPEMIDVKISDVGVHVGQKTFAYKDISKFHIVYQPPKVKNAYLDLAGGFPSRLTLLLEDQDPLKLHAILCQYVEENQEQTDEPIIEFLARILKI